MSLLYGDINNVWKDIELRVDLDPFAHQVKYQQ